MTSYTFNSESQKLTRSRLLKLYVLTALMVVGGFVCLEFAVRFRETLKQPDVSQSAAELMAALPTMTVSGRELNNQLLIQNVTLFSQYPEPLEITSGYVGTSRSKILHPRRFGHQNAIVGAGNSYNEMSYGLLLQAEILRLRFPNLKRVYVETSFLLRTSANLNVAPDHIKYLPLLKTLAPLCSDEVPGCQHVFAELDKQGKISWKPETRLHRSELRLTSLLANSDDSTPVKQDPLLAHLESNGEKKGRFNALIAKNEMLPEVANENVKVQRMRNISSNAPWDGLFDLFARWGQKHGIQIVMFQPPVRSDLYAYQVKYGLQQHVEDLQRVSSKYNIPFIDLDKPELGYINDWSLFSDEDHLETCVGSGLLILAVDAGVKRYEQQQDLQPVIKRSMVEEEKNKDLESCLN
ncbi:hypothetical protein [Pseudomonas sp. NPDC087639]|uniref:hypothetical protein n=1 Tax=Pseudomonas sp. NPDC087639 TaxID=3364445 RepID=UPI00381E254E